ncbi:MAG: beta-phosphoglucomutase [Candidatus Raymondbacteria bacterium RifOxyA12_full_50_37]|uniref:Beta-phosphoglucomutase n=1 Tax=Candidatus Raymondbacteria bacterium RIFOXYD12_FULL_49_13 TaxID=1817890 RepID=A0A1F7F663_UNCRA|nr:MAG: beta-phosphoglucomutase [Candidatus Raymondbacteria bacterium RifOxyA12_full_50_37]OGJ92107.1 MAG: beta-phosphoglucomutase [Candidatus Raymondbacteria bacterium RIFOXYA2_FULL_49_16]OGJ98463.1 MAG: beta-phosphoglucomutase [Candidatus Raymondbacteria bacterium RIFOXYC2_FULL_50_21]OGK00252.1 MAG: beta-phosphoglucomutase [Candidatus Raymondbacteria bacterium RifOxyB12_full_50_8]OGK02017.1 MAG: beta-phosphoglucomutase [Candidatus Raymondbacteria bacterium RIFOXYD12_FULL_49_13]OGK03796.1 MAG
MDQIKPHKKLGAVLFDLDGVLVDTAKCHFLAWKKIAEQLSITIDEKVNEKLKGVDRRDSFLIITRGRAFSEPEIHQYCTLKNGYFLEFISRLTAEDVLPGVRPLIKSLDTQGIKKAVCSASKNARTILANTGLIKYFDIVIDGHAIERGKPDPQVFLAAARALAVNPATCIVIEDAQAGIEAARRAGMKAVGVGERHVLAHADTVIKTLVELSVKTLQSLL